MVYLQHVQCSPEGQIRIYSNQIQYEMYINNAHKKILYYLILLFQNKEKYIIKS